MQNITHFILKCLYCCPLGPVYYKLFVHLEVYLTAVLLANRVIKGITFESREKGKAKMLKFPTTPFSLLYSQLANLVVLSIGGYSKTQGFFVVPRAIDDYGS